MSTLQTISDLEAKVSAIESKISVFESLVSNLPNVAQELGRINSDMSQIVKVMQSTSEFNNKRTSDLAQMDNMVITRLMGLEQSYASLAKTISAVISELTDSNSLNQESVMLRLRKSDEASDKARIDQMIELKVIAPTDIVLPDSVIVVSQDFTPTEGETSVVAEYRSFELSSPNIEDAVKQGYVGKTIGDVVSIALADGILNTKLLQVFNYVQSSAQGETAQNESVNG
jgi:hypothetical protein